jgi:hypothetical protein
MELVPKENVFTVPTTSLRAMVLGIFAVLRRTRRRRIDGAVNTGGTAHTLPDEIGEELTPLFETKHRSFVPVPLPITGCNVFIGMTLSPRK